MKEILSNVESTTNLYNDFSNLLKVSHQHAENEESKKSLIDMALKYGVLLPNDDDKSLENRDNDNEGAQTSDHLKSAIVDSDNSDRTIVGSPKGSLSENTDNDVSWSEHLKSSSSDQTSYPSGEAYPLDN